MDEPGPHIGILLYDGFCLLDVAGPADLLVRLPRARVTMIAQRRGPVLNDTGCATLTAERSFAEIDRVDVLVVPGGGERGTTAAMENEALLAWIRRVNHHTTWTTSVCTGSLILGEAGLLRDKATTYWACAGFMENRFGVRYEAARYVHTGKVITAAGVSAGLDMALYLAVHLADETVARALQLGIEYDPQPPLNSGNAATATDELKELALRLVAESTDPVPENAR